MIDATQAVGVTNDENGLESNYDVFVLIMVWNLQLLQQRRKHRVGGDEIVIINNAPKPPAIVTEDDKIDGCEKIINFLECPAITAEQKAQEGDKIVIINNALELSVSVTENEMIDGCESSLMSTGRG